MPQTQWQVFSGEGCLGGRCECGAVFVVDEIGRAGGQALMDAMALACDGDLDRALKLDAKRDFEVRNKPFQESQDRFGSRVGPQTRSDPSIYALKLKQPTKES